MNIRTIPIIVVFVFLVIKITLGAEISVMGIIDFDNSYSENVIIRSGCSEVVNFSIPQNAYNVITDNDSFVSDGFVIVGGCENVTTINYFIDAVEISESGFYRIERKFEDINLYDYKYYVKVPVFYKINRTLSSPANLTISYYDEENKIINFEQESDIYLLYFSEIKNPKNPSVLGVLNEIYPIAIIFVIATFVLGFIAAGFAFRREKQRMEKNNVPSYVLLDDEMRVLKIIKDNPGINQTQISRILKQSKAKTSMMIKNLEHKQLIEREKFGRSFKVYSTKTII